MEKFGGAIAVTDQEVTSAQSADETVKISQIDGDIKSREVRRESYGGLQVATETLQ